MEALTKQWYSNLGKWKPINTTKKNRLKKGQNKYTSDSGKNSSVSTGYIVSETFWNVKSLPIWVYFFLLKNAIVFAEQNISFKSLKIYKISLKTK
jgi:hypothetical protein